MTFQPVLPVGGLQGWMYLQRTYDAQLDAFGKAAEVQRSLTYFQEQVGSVTSASDLVADRRLREVALGAFGLQDDMDNVAFIRRILSDGTQANDALANRLADTRYREFSRAFGFGPGDLRKTGDSAAMKSVTDAFLARSFEQAVGAQDETMRIALNGQRELTEMAGDGTTETTKWYAVMGQPPLRALFEQALGLPQSFGQVDLDQQLEVFQDRLQSVTGSENISQFEDPARLERFLTIYHARAQVASSAVSTSGAATALVLLGGQASVLGL